MGIGIVDIALIVVCLIAIVWGIYRGFAGVFLGFFGTIVISVASVFIAMLIGSALMYTDSSVGVVNDAENNYGYSSLFSSVFTPIKDKFVDKETDLLDATLVMDAESESLLCYGPFGEDGENVLVPFSVALMANLPFGKGGDTSISILDSLITKYGCEGLTVSYALAALCASLIICAIISVVLFVVLFIVKLILRRLLFKYLDNHSTLSKVDRGVGAVVCVLVIVVACWAVVSFIGANAESFGMQETFADFLDRNTICSFFNQYNLFGAVGDSAIDQGNDNFEPVAGISKVIHQGIFIK